MTQPAKSTQRGLGRGLSALLGDDLPVGASPDTGGRLAKQVPVEALRPNQFQPRHYFDDTRITELVESVAEHGVLQPLIVRQRGDNPGDFEIIAGERRWRAAQRAGLHQVPVVVKEFTDAEALEVALIENIQRQDLTPIEEAAGYRQLMDEFGHNQERLGEVVGKSRSHVANMLRLLSLPEKIQDMVNAGTLSMGHARALIKAADPVGLARQIVEHGLNVRQAEKLAQSTKAGAKSRPRRAEPKDADTLALEQNLSNSLGLKVMIADKPEKGGKVTISYRTLEQLDEVCRRLSLGAADN
ncbi:MAG: ParB/RepB/Spo0J family partition protein [Sphingomonadales bacterium]